MSTSPKRETFSPTKSVTHVVFDLDGLLIDSEILYDQIYEKVVANYGKTYTIAQKVKVMGITIDHCAEILIKDLQLPLTPQEFIRKMEEWYPITLSEAKLMPGVERLLNHLKKYKIPMAIASSSRRDTYLYKTSRLPIRFEHYFHHITLAPEDPAIKRSKPAPDTFLVCKDRFPRKSGCPIDSKDCLVFEDSPAGVKAARAAGMQVVWIPDKNLYPNEMMKKNPEIKPTQVLKSMEDFRPDDFNLPPYDD